MNSKLIGRKVYITDRESIYHDEWGIVDYYNGDEYGVRIANGRDSAPIFSRDQFRVPRRESAKPNQEAIEAIEEPRAGETERVSDEEWDSLLHDDVRE